jgi:regulator of CtrA degradation
MHSKLHGLDAGLHRRLVDSLYVEAMVMADEARAYFDRAGAADRESLEPMARILFSCESLKVTTRLMHVIAWLLAHRAWQRGEIDSAALTDERFRLGEAAATDAEGISQFPFPARSLIDASMDLYDRVARFEARMLAGRSRTPGDVRGPTHALIDRLARSL